MHDHFDGKPCTNCESAPAQPEDLFCCDDCRDEYEGTGDYAEEDQDSYKIDLAEEE